MLHYSIKPIMLWLATSFALYHQPTQAAKTPSVSMPMFAPIININMNTPIINYQQNQDIKDINNIPEWQKKLKILINNPKNHLNNINNLNNNPIKFRIVQIGDSHTAGGFITDKMRNILQNQWGNGGIGWVFPTPVSGQRTSIVDYTGTQWQTVNSRKKSDWEMSGAESFPFGGIIARSQNDAILQISNKNQSINNYYNQNIQFPIRAIQYKSNQDLMINQNPIPLEPELINNQKWQYINLQNINFPLQIQGNIGDIWEIGAINIENNQSGVVVSALGLNGAQLFNWEKWRRDWTQDLAQTQADLVILAYGTNEAFNEQINLTEMQNYWRKTIQKIRETLPNAGILIVGTPESLKNYQYNQNDTCGTRPNYLSQIQSIQKNLAQEQGLLFWSWQDMMGGECSMNYWINNNLAAKDGVHFSKSGYEKMGESLANTLINMINLINSNNFSQTNTQ